MFLVSRVFSSDNVKTDHVNHYEYAYMQTSL